MEQHYIQVDGEVNLKLCTAASAWGSRSPWQWSAHVSKLRGVKLEKEEECCCSEDEEGAMLI